jgi:Sensors of blue-light using FAD
MPEPTTDLSIAPPPRSAPLLRLMYASVSAAPLTHGTLNAIFDTSVRNNTAQHITGVLMCDGRLNIQLLEGPEPAVRALWARIQDDPRHHCIVQLHEELGIPTRSFAQWAMLRGQSSRAEMLALVRNAYLATSQTEDHARPAWSQGIAPLMILLDGEFSHAYADALNHND